MKFVALIFALACSATAFAEVELGAIGSYHLNDQYNVTNIGAPEMTKGKVGWSLGALALYPLSQNWKARSGLQWEEMKIEHTVYSSNTSVVNWENLLVPLDGQWTTPLGELYIFGGFVFALNINGPMGRPAWSDLRADIGAGYKLYSLSSAQLALELEYMAGIKSVSANPDISMKMNILAANIVAYF